MLPLLSKCCCGCSLQTGSILIGAYQMVVGLLQVLIYALLEVFVAEGSHRDGWLYFWEEGYPWVQMILGILKMIAAIVLLYGANKDRHRLVFWWLIVVVSLTIIDAATFPVSVAVFFAFSSTADAVFTLISGLVEIALEVYFLWVVYSYYRIIEERAPGARPQTV